jgi:hypothetical protein
MVVFWQLAWNIRDSERIRGDQRLGLCRALGRAFNTKKGGDSDGDDNPLHLSEVIKLAKMGQDSLEELLTS